MISFIAAYPLGAFQVKIRSTFDVSRLMLYEKRSDSPNIAVYDLLVLPVLSLFVIGFLLASYFSIDVFSTGYSLNFSSELLGGLILGFFSMLATALIYASISKRKLNS